MDFFNFQRQIIDGTFEGTTEEEVKVNQRHLIDKILARYSAEYTVFREMMQNSNDAGANSAELKFITSLGKVVQIEYKNNGAEFNSKDWNRLSSISEGNPDESKIGFFGVGFYSLFSLCEEPLVCSGDKFMGFFWKVNQLYTKVGTLPQSTDKSDNGNRWSVFLMNLREPMNFPDPSDFASFISKSLLFTTSLCNLKVYFDEKCVISISKIFAPLIKQKTSYLRSEQSLFSTSNIHFQPVQMNVSYYPIKKSIKATLISAFWGSSSSDSSKVEYGEETKFIKFYKISYSILDSNLPSAFTKHYYRVTKKQPIKNPIIYLIFSSLNEQKESQDFSDNKNGYIFIGFPTCQSTGCKSHIYSQFIPTVEREQIDLVDSHLRTWNLELLNMSGQLLRICYESELKLICDSYSANINEYPSANSSKNIEYTPYIDQFVFLLQQFSFSASTPNSLVSKYLKSSFYNNILEFPVLSTKGLSTINNCRILTSDVPGLFTNNPLLDFINVCPVFFPTVKSQCSIFMQLLSELNCFKDFTVGDVLTQLQSTVFTLPNDKKRWLLFLNWFQTSYTRCEYYPVIIRNIKIKLNGADVVLSSYSYYALSSEIFPEFELPKNCIPQSLVSELELNISSFPFTKFTLIQFAEYIYTTNLGVDQYKRLIVNFNQSFSLFTGSEKYKLLQIFNNFKCIPTQHGLFYPCDVYVSNILFKDLPIINVKVSKQFESFLNLRSTVDLQLLFDRLNGLQWDFKQLLSHLTVQSYQKHELMKLRGLKIFPATNNNNYSIEEMYPNIPQFQQLNLPLLEYKWHTNKPECQFLIKLGINTNINLELILSKISDSRWFEYLLDHYNEYSIPENTLFIPAVDKNKQLKLGSIIDTFNDERSLILPGALYYSDNRLPLKPPTMSFILDSLNSLEYKDALECLEYLSTIPINHIFVERFRNIAFIPCNKVLYKPSQVYLNNLDNDFTDLFTFVMFSDSVNQWLLQLHVTAMPSPKDVCSLLPIQDMSHFLKLLIYISKHPFTNTMHSIKSNLLGLDCNNELKVSDVKDIYLNDDQTLISLFKPCTCPLDSLNTLYSNLGAKWISKAVDRKYKIAGVPYTTETCDELKKTLYTRLPLLYMHSEQDDNIKTSSKSVLINLCIQQVDDIQMTLTFNNVVEYLQTSCYYDKTLYINNLDDYEYAQILSGIIYKQSTMHQHLLIHTLLTIPLKDLEKRGYPVERLIPRDIEVPEPEINSSNSRESSTTMIEKSLSASKIERNASTAITLAADNKKNGYSRESLNNAADDQSQKQERPLIPPSLIPSLASIKQIFNKKQTVGNMNQTDEEMLKQQLKDSIKNIKREGSNEIASEPTTVPVQMTYCDINSGQSLVYFGMYKDYSLYVDKHENCNLNTKLRELESFGRILDIINSMYDIPASKINIYYDSNADNIAFNRNKTLFFNMVVFENIHNNKPLVSVVSYWYMVYAHELAHNHVQPHDANHEHYMAAYASSYLPTFVEYFNSK
eukprot:NODE_467_length_8122_cov_0.425776.p1 type:complete len:1491 gc:universal NODE_467_length_8122_cov_0.425776:7628-3156(-)